MNECLNADMRDALPDLIHGRLDALQAAQVEQHVAACAECAAELELLRVVAASAPAAPTIDVGRIAAALPTPTRHGFLLHRGEGQEAEPSSGSRPRRIWSRPAVRIAATIAIVTAGGMSLLVGRNVLSPENQVGASRGPDAVSQLPAAAASGRADVPDPATVSPAQSSPEVASAGVATTVASGLSLVGETHELSDENLSTLLAEIERLDAIPGVEPETIAPSIGESGESGSSGVSQ